MQLNIKDPEAHLLAQAIAFFLFGFAKNERENIEDDELRTFRDVAAQFLKNDDAALNAAVSEGKLQEIENGEEA